MCGICGFVDLHSRSGAEVLEDMVSTLRHRGPDDKGRCVYRFEQASVGLGHTRLSVLDLSSAGHQPMEYGNLVIVFNGEIYNSKRYGKNSSNRATRSNLNLIRRWRFTRSPSGA